MNNHKESRLTSLMSKETEVKVTGNYIILYAHKPGSGRKWDLLAVLIPERYLGGWGVAMGRRERTGNIRFDCTCAFMGNICTTILKNLNNVLQLLHRFVLSEIPSRDPFARLDKDAHCGIVYDDKIHRNLNIQREGTGFINYSILPL